jgi:hypothetical protein
MLTLVILAAGCGSRESPFVKAARADPHVRTELEQWKKFTVPSEVVLFKNCSVEPIGAGCVEERLVIFSTDSRNSIATLGTRVMRFANGNFNVGPVEHLGGWRSPATPLDEKRR